MMPPVASSAIDSTIGNYFMRSLPIFFLVLVLGHSVGLGEEKAREWPFTPVKSVQPPGVKTPDWASNEIDRFILSRLEADGLSPAQEASRRVLIRRLYFDLLGLPPAPEAVEAFVDDKDPKAYSKLVDGLLKDKRYGERWARLWLDLARYADTAGYEGDPDLPHAWRYRDYVIDAFNSDKPYNQFIREQLAGDEFSDIMGAGDLPGTKPEHVVALTFLRLAPFTEPRGDETRHELLSEMTATVSSVFLGLTVGCAKCHDHKYDGIPTRDFYRMKAFFSTVQIPRPEPGDGFQIGGPLPADFYRPGEKKWAESLRAKLDGDLKNSKNLLAEFLKIMKPRLGDAGSGSAIQAGGGPLGNNYAFENRAVADGEPHITVLNSDGSRWSFFTDGKEAGAAGTLSGSNNGNWFGDIPGPSFISMGKHTQGSGNPGGNPYRGAYGELLVYDHPLAKAERAALQDYFGRKYAGKAAGPLEPPRAGLRFWLDASDIDADPESPNPSAQAPVSAWKDRISGLELVQADGGLQPKLSTIGKGAPAVDFDDDFMVGAAKGASFLKDQAGSIVSIYSSRLSAEGYGFVVGGGGCYITTAVNPSASGSRSVENLIKDFSNGLFTPEERYRYRYLRTRDKFVKQHLKRLKPVAMSLRHSYGPPYEPGVPTTRVMIRGEYDNPGEVVKPGFLSCVTGHDKPAKIRLDPFKRWPTRSRRMALANWIASSSNPLTSRVMVNRLWHWHFGRGIVSTPSDFGKLSGGAVNPELLDWLAERFVRSKWSIKSIHRLICNSSTYRQSSINHGTKALLADPENKLVWRFNRRRLEAEAVRDSVLSVSGRLNPEQFGLPIFPPLPGSIEETVKWDNSKWDTQGGEEGRKRSIYIYQQRTLNMPFLQSFDSTVCDTSRDQRRSSVTPLQSLAMYNGDFVSEEAKFFAARVRKSAGEDPAAQVEYAFQLALGRSAGPEEAEKMIELLRSSAGPGKDSLAALCRVLFNTSEFIYID
ncbi:MAG: DUF1549 and DUF1553 domain-containing protein [Planctomycetes bacterium]|nr:DUF1549 and DUF1553 domain-containing protein [Planctomycetota bacterium]